MLKRTVSLLTACTLVLSLTVLPASASGSCAESTARADKLASLHLFQGTAAGYNLDATPTRLQGLIMLIRLLGLEEEAKAFDGPAPFTDTESPYVGYACANGITQGTSAATFSPGKMLTASNYVTFLLRALGYDDSKGEFSRSTQMDFAAGISMMDQAAVDALPAVTLNRGDMVDLSFAALGCKLNGKDQTLAEKLCADGVFTEAEGRAAGVLGGSGWVYRYEPHEAPAPVPDPNPGTSSGAGVSVAGSGVWYEVRNVATSGGNLAAKVIRVNTKTPGVTVKAALVNNTVGATATFKEICQKSGALAVVNGNFFACYSDFKAPIGHVMVDGQFLYGNSGVTSLGITKDGEIRVGRIPVFTKLTASDGSTWYAYEINTNTAGEAVIFTPAYGQSVTAKHDGSVITVAGGVITGYQPIAAGSAAPIPQNGYVVFMDTAFTSAEYFRTPAVGSTMTMEYTIHETAGADHFSLDGLVSVVSGAPRLVQDGAIVTTLEPGFTEARFTTSSAPRTAAGVNADGELVLASVPSATIQQMRELMLALGCVDAFNMDGGASCAMYYDGQVLAAPGRELTVTLQVFAG